MRYFIVGASGESDRWLVDTLEGRVHQIDAADLDLADDLVKGVAVAVAAADRSGLTSHQIFGG
jgi:hypothetical protein